MNDKETFTPGLIFNLKNNFSGWKDKTENETTHILPKPIMELDAPTDSPIIHIEE